MTSSAPQLIITPDMSPRQQARALYWQGWRVARIAETIGEKASTIHTWKTRDKWEEATPIDRVEGTIEARLIQ
ncbi:terminase gpP N-terminus-related DNA-binding protein, partial [Cellvibrio mixtus]|uniref:terminase gpP N-terminus-related DNA-binding protein n=1 Tax=Cellvibrio mixtus TaxID=39650 RepID=UPI00058680BC